MAIIERAQSDPTAWLAAALVRANADQASVVLLDHNWPTCWAVCPNHHYHRFA